MRYNRGLCACGNRQESKGRYKDRQIFGRYCSQCRRNTYKTFKKDSCEECGFVPIHKIQLDVDHIDGDHHNHDESNLQTLCANCHRLKTYVNQDFVSKK